MKTEAEAVAAVKDAQQILRDAEIEREVIRNADGITEHGRCPKHRNHFDRGSFFMGVGLACLVMLLLAGVSAGHHP